MKKSRSTESQVLAVLRQAEGGRLAPDLCREHVAADQAAQAVETLEAGRPYCSRSAHHRLVDRLYGRPVSG